MRLKQKAVVVVVVQLCSCAVSVCVVTVMESASAEKTLNEYLEPIVNEPDCECIIVQDFFNGAEGLTSSGRIRPRFNPSFGNWTSLGLTRFGQRSHFKASSFECGIEKSINDPSEPMKEGEIRQISVVTTTMVHLQYYQGEVMVLRAWVPKKQQSEPRCSTTSTVVRGLNCLPVLLPDRQISGMKRSKRVLRIRGCPSQYLSTSNIVASQKGKMMIVSIAPGQHLNAFAEWVVLQKEPKINLFLTQQRDLVDHKSEKAKTTQRIEQWLEANAAHPPDKNVRRHAERIASAADAFVTSTDYYDAATIVGFLDLMCSGAFDGLTISMIAAPREFPLFMASCIVLGASPEMFGLNPTTEEDARLGREMNQIIKSTLLPCDKLSRQTSIEIVVQLAVENMGTQTVVVEHMRRQGLAVISELLSGHTLGVFNPTNVRAANRSTVFEKVLKILLEIDSWLHFGVFNGLRESAENDEEQNELFQGLNCVAVTSAKLNLVEYFRSSPMRLASRAGIPITAVRPNTRTKCGLCSQPFDVRTSIFKGNAANCYVCAAFLCDACYDNTCKDVKMKSKGRVACTKCEYSLSSSSSTDNGPTEEETKSDDNNNMETGTFQITIMS